ncbi:MAG TPA: hypothetical protein VF712_10885 [Thermoleophilaceae bacterium]
MALAVALLGVTGCGGSDVAPPAPAPAPPAATNVSTQGSGGLGSDFAQERREAKAALRKWGRAATKACRRLDGEQAPYGRRFRAMSASPDRSKDAIVDAGRVFKAYTKIAEREYDLVREVPLPQQAEAIDAIDSFLQKEEEAIMLLQRAALELDAHNDFASLVRTAVRFRDLLDDYRRAARAVYAEPCFD